MQIKMESCLCNGSQVDFHAANFVPFFHNWEHDEGFPPIFPSQMEELDI